MSKFIDEMNRKYGTPKNMLIQLVKKGLDRGLTLKAVEISIRMSLGMVNGGDKEFFTVEDMMEISGEDRKTILQKIEEIRLAAIARCENPDKYVTQVSKYLN